MPRIPLFNQGAQPASRAPRVRTPMAPTTPVRVNMGSIDGGMIANFSSEPEADPRPWLRQGQATAQFGEAIQQAGEVLNKLAMAEADSINRLDVAAGQDAMDNEFRTFKAEMVEQNVDPRHWKDLWTKRAEALGQKVFNDRLSPVAKEELAARLSRFQARSEIEVRTDAAQRIFQLDADRIRADWKQAVDRGDLPAAHAKAEEGVNLRLIPADEGARMSIAAREKVKAKNEEEGMDQVWTSASIDPRFTFDHFRAGGFPEVKDPARRLEMERQLGRMVEEKKQTFWNDQLKAVELGERPPFTVAEIRTWLREGRIPDAAGLNALESFTRGDDPAMVNSLMERAATYTPGAPDADHVKAGILNDLVAVSPGYRTVVRDMLDKSEKGENAPNEALVFKRIRAGVGEGRWGSTKNAIPNPYGGPPLFDVDPAKRDAAEKKALAAQMHMAQWFADKKAKGGYKPGEEWAELDRITDGAALSGFGGMLQRSRFGSPVPAANPDPAPARAPRYDVTFDQGTRTTHFAFPGDAYKDSNSQTRIGAFTTADDAAKAKSGDFSGSTLLQEGDFAASRDVEAKLISQGMPPGSPLLLNVGGQWVAGRLWDRTSDKLSGRVDFYSPTGEHPLNGKPVEGALKIHLPEPAILAKDDWEEVRMAFLDLNEKLPEDAKRPALGWLAKVWARQRPVEKNEKKLGGGLFDDGE